MHKVNKPKRQDILKMQQAVVAWTSWAKQHPEDAMRQYLAQQVVLAANRQISIRELHKRVNEHAGLIEASKFWHDLPRFD